MNHEHFRHRGKKRIALASCLLIAVLIAIGGIAYASIPRSLDAATRGRAHLTASLDAGNALAAAEKRFGELSQRDLVPYDGPLPPITPLDFACVDGSGGSLFELSIWDSEEPWIVGVNLDGHSSWYLAYPRS